MKRFKKNKAWNELAGPALLSLPTSILQLVLRVMNESCSIMQNNDLSLPWPDTDLQNAFQEVESEDLAKASRIVWAAGHWHPGANNWLRPLMHTGTYWRFSAYADRVLLDRMMLKKYFNTEFFNFEVHEGFIRAIASYKNNWKYTDVALATSENMKTLIDMAKSCKTDNWNEIENTLNMMKAMRPSTEPISSFFEAYKVYN